MFPRFLNSDQAPQHFLNFLPLPQGQGSLRPTGPVRVRLASRSFQAAARVRRRVSAWAKKRLKAWQK